MNKITNRNLKNIHLREKIFEKKKKIPLIQIDI
jgi:hypothetical protein